MSIFKLKLLLYGAAERLDQAVKIPEVTFNLSLPLHVPPIHLVILSRRFFVNTLKLFPCSNFSPSEFRDTFFSRALCLAREFNFIQRFRRVIRRINYSPLKDVRNNVLGTVFSRNRD